MSDDPNRVGKPGDGMKQTDISGHGPDYLDPLVRRTIYSPPRRAPYRNTALVLGGGGSKGAFQVGVLKYLYEVRGFRPGIITATSVGALNGAKLAEGRGSGNSSSRAALDGLVRLWKGITGNESIYVDNPTFQRLLDAPDDIKNWALWTIAGSLSLPILGQVLGSATAPNLSRLERQAQRLESISIQQPLIELALANLDRLAIAESGIKLRMAIVNRDTGQMRYVTEGGDVVTDDDVPIHRGEWSIFVPETPGAPRYSPGAPTVFDGVIASSAIPMVFEPKEIAGEYYWDGAIREDVPIRKALQMGATDLTIIITSPRKYAPASLGSVPIDLTLLHRSMQAMDIMADQVFQDDLSGVLDVLDVLHELGHGVAPRVRSFPLPRDPFTQTPWMIPYYIVIEPPFTLGDITAFEPEIIGINIELGEIVARHAVANPPDEAQKRVDIIHFLQDKITRLQDRRDRLRERAQRGLADDEDPGRQGPLKSMLQKAARADYWAEHLQGVLTDYRNTPIVPLRAKRE